MSDFEQYIGSRTDNGTQYPAVNLAGASYTLPPNKVGLGKGKFAVLSGLPGDNDMIETLKGYLTSGISKEATDNAPKNKPARRLSASGDIPSGSDDVSGPA